jgi:hypothetical protein
VAGERKRLHNEQLYVLYSSTNIIRRIKPRRMKWTGHLACLGKRKVTYRVWMGSSEGKNHLEDLGVDGRIILKWIMKKWDQGAWAGWL